MNFETFDTLHNISNFNYSVVNHFSDNFIINSVFKTEQSYSDSSFLISELDIDFFVNNDNLNLKYFADISNLSKIIFALASLQKSIYLRFKNNDLTIDKVKIKHSIINSNSTNSLYFKFIFEIATLKKVELFFTNINSNEDLIDTIFKLQINDIILLNQKY